MNNNKKIIYLKSRLPRWTSKLVIWELNSIFKQNLSFVSANFYCGWKHIINYFTINYFTILKNLVRLTALEQLCWKVFRFLPPAPPYVYHLVVGIMTLLDLTNLNDGISFFILEQDQGKFLLTRFYRKKGSSMLKVIWIPLGEFATRGQLKEIFSAPTSNSS